MNEPVKPGRYRHFKGGEYQVIDLALHSETEQVLVVYRPLYGQERLWVRPLEMFQDHKQLDGRPVARFERIADPDSVESSAQQRVRRFCQQHDLRAPAAARLLDLCSELGELSKVWLKSSAYGSHPEAAPDPQTWQEELGDTLFALLCLANESGVDAEQALEQTLERYRQRIEVGGEPGSDAEPKRSQ